MVVDHNALGLQVYSLAHSEQLPVLQSPFVVCVLFIVFLYSSFTVSFPCPAMCRYTLTIVVQLPALLHRLAALER